MKKTISTIKSIILVCSLILIAGKASAHYEMNISQVTNAPFCPGESFQVTYGIHFVFDSTNVFTVQLSNATGSFASPIAVGTFAATGAGTITCQIPNTIPAGTGYKIRMISSSPVAVGTTFTSTFTVGVNPTASIVAGGPTTFCSGLNVNLSVTNTVGNTYAWLKNNNIIANASTNSYTATQSGSYKVIVTNTNGCSTTSAGKQVTVRSLPTASVTTTGSTVLCNGSTVLLTAPANVNNTYQWRKGSNPITGATANSYTANAAGTYRVLVTNQYGCTRLSNPGIQVTSGPCRIGDDFTKEAITTFPNPFNEQLSILMDNEIDQHVSISISNIIGEIVFTKNVEISAGEQKINLDLNELSSGVFMMSILTSDGMKTQKIIKQ